MVNMMAKLFRFILVFIIGLEINKFMAKLVYKVKVIENIVNEYDFLKLEDPIIKYTLIFIYEFVELLLSTAYSVFMFVLPYLFFIAIVLFEFVFEIICNLIILWISFLLFIKYIIIFFCEFFFIKSIFSFIYLFLYFAITIFKLFFNFCYYLFFTNLLDGDHDYLFSFFMKRADIFLIICDLILKAFYKKLIVHVYIFVYYLVFFFKYIYLNIFLVSQQKIFYYFRFYIGFDYYYNNGVFENIKTLLLGIFYAMFDFTKFICSKIKTVLVLSIIIFIPFVIIKYIVITFATVYSFISVTLWLSLNLLKYIIILFFQMLRKIDMFNKFNVKDKKEFNEEMKTDEDDHRYLGGDELFGNRDRVYEGKKRRRFIRVFYFSSFYFSRKRRKEKYRGKHFYHERPYLNLNKFLWTKSGVFNRPIVFISFLRKRSENTYGLMKNTMYYKDFFSFVNKVQKYKTDYFSKNVFYEKLLRRYYIRFQNKFNHKIREEKVFNVTDKKFEKDEIESKDFLQYDSYRSKVIKRLQKFNYMKKKYFSQFFPHGFFNKYQSKFNKKEFESERRRYAKHRIRKKKKKEFNFREFVYSMPTLKHYVTKVLVKVISFFKKFFLALPDINRIDFFFILKSTIYSHVTTIFFDYNLSIIVILFAASAIGVDLFLLDEERMIYYGHFKDFYDFSQFVSNWFSQQAITRYLRPEAFVKHSADFYFFFKKHKKVFFFFILLFFYWFLVIL
jgi:hypothetical protein